MGEQDRCRQRIEGYLSRQQRLALDIASAETFAPKEESFALMNQLWTRIGRPVSHSEFWVPGLILVSVSTFALGASIYLMGWSHLASREGGFLAWAFAGVVFGCLIIGRTRIGTTAYFGLLFWALIDRVEQGYRLETFLDWLRLAPALLFSYLFAMIGWQQVEYHFRGRADGGRHHT